MGYNAALFHLFTVNGRCTLMSRMRGCGCERMGFTIGRRTVATVSCRHNWRQERGPRNPTMHKAQHAVLND